MKSVNVIVESLKFLLNTGDKEERARINKLKREHITAVSLAGEAGQLVTFILFIFSLGLFTGDLVHSRGKQLSLAMLGSSMLMFGVSKQIQFTADDINDLIIKERQQAKSELLLKIHNKARQASNTPFTEPQAQHEPVPVPVDTVTIFPLNNKAVNN